ncbi:PAS domain S-box protein [Baekduia soli]|uniref:histidine kinase n=1 Tax=Baekduia soli TaxID=496014 RepID=A0A5B8U9M7_9ACTN|nr:PAS domain S-box protein [Baekduia soli]QEC49352.1 PAS domain S-box protein [Baekduia soli]
MPETDVVATPDGERHADQLALLVERMADDAIFLLDPDGIIITWNAGAVRSHGYRPEEIIGRHVNALTVPEGLERGDPERMLGAAARDGRAEEEGWSLRKDGARFWGVIGVTALRDDEGRLVAYGAVVRDLTARRAIERRLRRSADELTAKNAQLEQFRRLITAVRDYAIFVLHPGGQVATWNPGAEHIKGYRAEEAIGRHFSMFYTEEDRLAGRPERALEAAARDGRFEGEGWRVRKDGTRLWASVVITALRDDDGALTGYAKVTRDLSDRRAAEEALRAANDRLQRSNEELERFASVAAHDLREPLRTVSGFAGLVLARHGDAIPPEGHAHLQQITAAAERMHALVDRLLEYARGGGPAAAPEVVDVQATLSAVLAELEGAITDRGVRVTVQLGPDVHVLAERVDVEAALRNLVSNAVKFAAAQDPAVTVRSEPTPGGWLIEVIDNGIGIDPAHRPRIFQAFHRLHGLAEYPGTGLGLAIAQRAVERSGGTIGVESALGEGSRFWFALPGGA